MIDRKPSDYELTLKKLGYSFHFPRRISDQVTSSIFSSFLTKNIPLSFLCVMMGMEKSSAV